MTTACDERFNRLRALAEEFHALARDLGLLASISLHGRSEWPAGIEPMGEPFVTCHGSRGHTAHRSADLEPIRVIVGRDALPDEIAASPRHDPACAHFRREAYLPPMDVTVRS